LNPTERDDEGSCELKLLRLPISVREGTCPMCSGLTINLQLSID